MRIERKRTDEGGIEKRIENEKEKREERGEREKNKNCSAKGVTTCHDPSTHGMARAVVS